LIGTPEEKRPLGRPRCRWGDNITMDLKEIGWEGVACTDLDQDRSKGFDLVNKTRQKSFGFHEMQGMS
jgi:hypothetical protein